MRILCEKVGAHRFSRGRICRTRRAAADPRSARRPPQVTLVHSDAAGNHHTEAFKSVAAEVALQAGPRGGPALVLALPKRGELVLPLKPPLALYAQRLAAGLLGLRLPEYRPAAGGVKSLQVTLSVGADDAPELARFRAALGAALAGGRRPLAPRSLNARPGAEAAVLAAASANLHVVALRPHLVYGPDDPHLLPRLLARARAGRLRIVGDGTNRVSLTYVDNAAAAHLQAVDALLRDGAASAAHGRAFFVNDAEPVVLWDWLNRLFGEVGVAPVRARVPSGLAYALGSLAEGVWSVLGRDDDPPMTRFVARQLATSHTYSLAPAREAFGYVPEVEGDEGFGRTVAWVRGSRVG